MHEAMTALSLWHEKSHMSSWYSTVRSIRLASGVTMARKSLGVNISHSLMPIRPYRIPRRFSNAHLLISTLTQALSGGLARNEDGPSLKPGQIDSPSVFLTLC